MKSILYILAGFCFIVTSMLSWAHGGEDHGSEASPVFSVMVLPRATAQTEEFELVIVLQGKKLIVHLDTFASNTPVTGAHIEIESAPLLNAVASPAEPGVYSVDLPPGVFSQPGKYPLTVTVQAADTADLLSATLDIAAPPAENHAHARIEDQRLIWGALVLALLLVAGVLGLLIRRKMAGTYQGVKP